MLTNNVSLKEVVKKNWNFRINQVQKLPNNKVRLHVCRLWPPVSNVEFEGNFNYINKLYKKEWGKCITSLIK